MDEGGLAEQLDRSVGNCRGPGSLPSGDRVHGLRVRLDVDIASVIEARVLDAYGGPDAALKNDPELLGPSAADVQSEYNLICR
jgi:hypothetical protein